MTVRVGDVVQFDGRTAVVVRAPMEKKPPELDALERAAVDALEAVADRPVTATVPIDIDDIRFLTFATEVLKRQPPIVADLAPIKAEIDAFHKLSVELPLPAPTKTKRGPQLSKREMRQRQMQHNRRGGR